MSEPQPDEQVERAADFWNEFHKDPEGQAHDNFLNHPLIQAYISLRAFGQIVGHLDVVVAELRRRTAPGDRIVSVGCGFAGKERAIARALPDRQFVGLDIADEILEATREEVAREGLQNLSLGYGNFNDLELEPNAYRALLGLGAVHHVENLESFWAGVARGLTPDGCVLSQEYTGPNRFQWTEEQVREGDRVLAELVPSELQSHHRTIQRTPVDVMLKLDPSEAVRSAEILPTCRDAGFEIEGYAGAGCALLQPVLMYQIAEFEPTNWEHNHVLSELFREEDRLMKAGVLGDDFAAFVARPPA